MLYPDPQIYGRLKTIFVHVPKTAGMAIEQLLRQGEEDPGRGHTTAEAYRRRFPKEFASYFKFGVVRDPLDRFISAYSFLKQMPVRIGLNNRIVHESDSMDHLAGRILNSPGVLWNNVHFLPQHRFVCDRKGAVLVDRVIHYERLEHDWPEICRRVGIPVEPLPKVNVSVRVSQDEVTDVVRAVLRRAYARDFEIFGYTPP